MTFSAAVLALALASDRTVIRDTPEYGVMVDRSGNESTVILDGPISAASVADVIGALDAAHARGDRVVLFISSGGGTYSAGTRLARYIENGPALTCRAGRYLMSMAVYVMEACDRREAGRDTTVLIHDPRPAGEDDARERELVASEMAAYIALRAGISPAEYRAATAAGDRTMTAAEALAFGLLDVVR